MKNILVIIFVISLGCCSSFKSAQNTSQLNLTDWQVLVLKTLDTVKTEQLYEAVTLENVRLDLSLINIERLKDFIWNSIDKDKEIDHIDMYYHFSELEVNYTVVSVLIEYADSCVVFRKETYSDDYEVYRDCSQFPILPVMESKYVDSGYLVKTVFNSTYEVEDIKISVGVGFAILRPLYRFYDSSPQ